MLMLVTVEDVTIMIVKAGNYLIFQNHQIRTSLMIGLEMVRIVMFLQYIRTMIIPRKLPLKYLNQFVNKSIIVKPKFYTI